MSADLLAHILIATAALPATGFVIVYATSPWWTSFTGRNLMTFSIGMALLVDISLAYELFGDEYPGRDLVRLTVYLLIVGGIWGQFINLLQVKLRHRQPR